MGRYTLCGRDIVTACLGREHDNPWMLALAPVNRGSNSIIYDDDLALGKAILFSKLQK